MADLTRLKAEIIDSLARVRAEIAVDKGEMSSLYGQLRVLQEKQQKLERIEKELSELDDGIRKSEAVRAPR